MVEQLLSPGSLLTETDKSFLPAQFAESDAAIIGPTAKGKVNDPTVVTNYSEYLAKFGSTIEDPDNGKPYNFLTTISAQNYFNNGGTSLLVTRVASGSWNPATSSLDYDSGSVVFETLSDGEGQNSGTKGTKDNVKWEITSSNPNNGSFTFIVRRGDDTDNNKKVLESFNVSLDPEANNYIEKAIGNMVNVIKDDGEVNYIQPQGDYPNISRYIRVKEANFDEIYELNDDWKAIITGFSGESGSFVDGEGEVTEFGDFYENIDNTNQGGVEASDYDIAIGLLYNPDEFRYNIISTPGLVYSEHSSAMSVLASNTKNRGDAIYPLDLVKYETGLNAVISEAGNINNSYASTYWPWAQINDPAIGKSVWVPMSTLIPGAYKFNDRAGETWDAPAGITRGGLSIVRQVERKLTISQRDDLYQSNINPIATFPGVGICIYGNKTLQTEASALDRVNVRRLLIEIKGFVKRICDRLTFEPNSIATWNNFVNQVTPRLENIQQRNGLNAYRVIMDESLNTPDVEARNELHGAIYLQPTRTSEFIYIDFIIQPTGVEFAD